MKQLLIIFAVLLLTIVTTSLADVLPSDNFNDNLRNTSMWNLFEGDPCNEWLDETNQRLELRSPADANDTGAGYFSNGWGFSTTDNFSLKVDFYCSPPLWPETYNFGTTFGLGKWGGDPIWNNNASIDASSYEDKYGNNGMIFSCDKTTDGNDIEVAVKERSQYDGTLYISYDASKDELYLSNTGYWAANAWVAIPGLLKGEWDSTVVIPSLGGHTQNKNRALASGDAYLDNFVVDSGTIIPVPAIYFDDLKKFCEHWLETGCVQPYGCEGTDLDNDTDVDFKDFAIFAQNWFNGI